MEREVEVRWKKGKPKIKWKDDMQECLAKHTIRGEEFLNKKEWKLSLENTVVPKYTGLV